MVDRVRSTRHDRSVGHCVNPIENIDPERPAGRVDGSAAQQLDNRVVRRRDLDGQASKRWGIVVPLGEGCGIDVDGHGSVIAGCRTVRNRLGVDGDV